MEESNKKPEIKEEKKEINIEELRKKLEECQKLKDEYLAGWQRARADFLNYKKEEMERIGEMIKWANEELVLKFLPILDNFNLVEKKIPQGLLEDERVKGLLQIRTQMKDFLKSQGVEEIDCLGQKFDPNFHEVVEDVPAEALVKAGKEVKESGIIIEEIQKGYMIQDRLLRPAKVRVVK